MTVMRESGPLRLLLVDDNEIFLASLRAYFETIQGVVVAGLARSGEQAVALTERDPTELVLMDLSMPGLGGIEATRILKTLPRAPRVAILTLHVAAAYRAAAHEAGADFFIPKNRLHEEIPAVLARITRP